MEKVARYSPKDEEELRLVGRIFLGVKSLEQPSDMCYVELEKWLCI